MHREMTERGKRRRREGSKKREEAKEEKNMEVREKPLEKVRFSDINYQESLCL